MAEIDYRAVVKTSLDRFNELFSKRSEIDSEMSRLRQFIRAAIHLLPENERENFMIEAAEAFDESTNNPSLTDAIRSVLSKYPNWLGVAAIRDRLTVENFDFSSYSSNPLASISTTLRRLKDAGEVEKNTSGASSVYKLKRPVVTVTKAPPPPREVGR